MVVSREDPDAERAICVCVPLTTQVRGGNYEQPLPKVKWLPAGDGVANVLGIKSIPHARLERLAGRFESAVYEAVQWRICWMVQQRDKPSK
jgi:mRNA-degrading endonuclease toxin of MazEF toxin-antitoxin module